MLYLMAILAFLISLSSSYADPQKIDLDSIAGVYKKTFQNAYVNGEAYKSEDVLEIVKISPDTAYFRTDLAFYNGHTCKLYGITKLQDDGLVYEKNREAAPHKCTFKIELKDNRLALVDENLTCKEMSCGERGAYSDEVFALKDRRPIRYMPRLLNSREYKEAVDEYKKTDKQD